MPVRVTVVVGGGGCGGGTTTSTTTVSGSVVSTPVGSLVVVKVSVPVKVPDPVRVTVVVTGSGRGGSVVVVSGTIISITTTSGSLPSAGVEVLVAVVVEFCSCPTAVVVLVIGGGRVIDVRSGGSIISTITVPGFVPSGGIVDVLVRTAV